MLQSLVMDNPFVIVEKVYLIFFAFMALANYPARTDNGTDLCCLSGSQDVM